MADAVGRALSRSPRGAARTTRHLRSCPGRSRPAGSSDGPGAAVSRHAFVARSDPTHDFHRRAAGSARVRCAPFSALDLPTVRIGVHGPRSCPGPPSYLVHRYRITMPALWRTAHPARARASRALHNIIADGESYELHARVRDRLALAFETGRPVAAVTRAMKALAAPVPMDKRARYIARNRGRLPCGPDRVPPLLWQLDGTRKLRRLMDGYQSWRPPDGRPYAVWPPAGQVAATMGLTVLAAAGMAMWEILADLGLVEHGDHLVVKDILSGAQAVQTVAN
jgi:hypothetical protein